MNHIKSILLVASILLAIVFIISCGFSYEELPGNDTGETNSLGTLSSSSSSGIGISSSGGSGVSVAYITIKNSTGYTISEIYVKLSTSTDWGNNLWGYSYLSDGDTKELNFSKPLSAGKKYDIRLSSSGNVFTKYNSSVDGRTIVFTTADLTDESNFPSITIQNRTGVSFNEIYVRPSSMSEASSDWGKNYGSLSNNSNQSITIPIPPSNYTSFDIQMRSSNPTNTYTKRVTVSNGTVVTYTSADSDNPLIGLPIVVIDNNTGYSIGGIWIRQPTSTDWGDNLWGYSYLSDGESRTFTLSKSLSENNVYDIRLEQNSSNGFMFIKYRVTVSEGMIIKFTTADLNNESDHPSITVQNRIGVNSDELYIKPSSSGDWGKSFGYISNNNSRTVIIPIPPSSYTSFDIQIRSSNPTSTYTMQNVPVTDGMILTFTRANADSPLIGSPIIVIENNTTYTISGIWIKSSVSTDWGNNLWGYSYLSDRESRTFELSQSAGSIDIRLSTNSSTTGGNQFVKSNLSISDGMVITFTGSDLE